MRLAQDAPLSFGLTNPRPLPVVSCIWSNASTRTITVCKCTVESSDLSSSSLQYVGGLFLLHVFPESGRSFTFMNRYPPISSGPLKREGMAFILATRIAHLLAPRAR